MHQIRFRLGLRPRPLGELIQRSPMHPSWWEGACCPLPRTPFPVLDPLGLEPRPLVPRPRCSHAFFFPNLGMSVQTLLHAAVECLSRPEVGPTLQHVCPCTITSMTACANSCHFFQNVLVSFLSDPVHIWFSAHLLLRENRPTSAYSKVSFSDNATLGL